MIYTLLWAAWALMFAVVEGRALLDRKPESTLSGHVWAIFNVRDPVTGRPRGGWDWKRYGLAAFMIWLTGHLVLGWWAG